MLHRDVKPANILITRFGEPALADFGLAVLTETRESSITLELTPAYAAPEMFHHGRPVPASDVYGLCATLYALMRGRPPRWRENHNPTLVSLVDMFAEPVPDMPDVPAELTALLRRGMANEPDARPSAAELRDEFLGFHRDPDPTMILRPVTPGLPACASSRCRSSRCGRSRRPPEPRKPNRAEETTQRSPSPACARTPRLRPSSGQRRASRRGVVDSASPTASVRSRGERAQ